MDNLENHPLIQSYIRQNRFGKLIGMSFTIISPGNIEYKLKVREDHLATPKAVHGGLISALLDATVGVGALTVVCGENRVVSTVEMSVKFFEPALLNDELRATSELMKRGNRLIFMEGKVYNGNDTLIAKASATLNAYPADKAGY